MKIVSCSVTVVDICIHSVLCIYSELPLLQNDKNISKSHKSICDES